VRATIEEVLQSDLLNSLALSELEQRNAVIGLVREGCAEGSFAENITL